MKLHEVKLPGIKAKFAIAPRLLYPPQVHRSLGVGISKLHGIRRRRMKQGFTLLEILIAIAISAAVLSAVFNIFYQINKSFAVAERISGIDMRVSILQHQLERDISGVFIPLVVQKKKGEKASEKKEKSKEAKQQKKEEHIPLAKAFYSVNKEKIFFALTFITSNPLPAYGKLKSRIARVAYILEEDKGAARLYGKEKKSYKLFRAESPMLYFDDFVKKTKKRAIKYELVDNIKSIVIDYVVEIIKKKDESKKNGSPPRLLPTGPKIVYKTFKEWGAKQIKESKKQRPDFLHVKVSFWDNPRRKFDDFSFKIVIMQMVRVQEPKKKKAGKKQGSRGRPQKKRPRR